MQFYILNVNLNTKMLMKVLKFVKFVNWISKFSMINFFFFYIKRNVNFNNFKIFLITRINYYT